MSRQVATLLYGADIVNEGKRWRGYLAINPDGLIEEVGQGDPDSQLLNHARDARDLNGAMILPGIIDTHVHFREPGLTHKGTIASESAKALSGGVTSVIEMPNTKPPTVDMEAWQWKMDRAAATSRVNYAFYLGATAHNLPLLTSADYTKVPAVKLFLGSSTGGMLLDDDALLRRLLSEVPALIAVHAESEPLIAAGRQWAQTRFGRNVPLPMHSVIRSRRACIEASTRIVDMARQTGARLHLLHISTADELSLLTPGDCSGKRITAETCPNYLLHTCLEYPRRGAAIKCNPSVKLPTDRDALRRAVATGLIDTIATDHAPHTPDDKRGDALTAASGVDSIGGSLTEMLDLARDGHFSIATVVERMAHNPATIFGIDRRGFIREGYWADLTIMHDSYGATPTAVYLNGSLAYCGAHLPAAPRPLTFTPR